MEVDDIHVEIPLGPQIKRNYNRLSLKSRGLTAPSNSRCGRGTSDRRLPYWLGLAICRVLQRFETKDNRKKKDVK